MPQEPGYNQFRTTNMNYYSYPKEFIEWHQGIVVRQPAIVTQPPKCSLALPSPKRARSPLLPCAALPALLLTPGVGPTPCLSRLRASSSTRSSKPPERVLS